MVSFNKTFQIKFQNKKLIQKIQPQIKSFGLSFIKNLSPITGTYHQRFQTVISKRKEFNLNLNLSFHIYFWFCSSKLDSFEVFAAQSINLASVDFPIIIKNASDCGKGLQFN
jgi:hypothetical protein